MERQDETENGLVNGLAGILARGSGEETIDPDNKYLPHALALLANVIDQDGLGVTLTDSLGNFVYVNNTCATMHGWPAEELLGKPASILYTSPESLQADSSVQVIGPSIAGSEESQRIRRDGSVFRAYTYSLPIKDHSGETVGFLTTIRAVTESGSDKQAMQPKREGLEVIIDSVTDHMMLLDEELTVVWANNAAKGFYGADVVGRKCYRAFHHRERACKPCIVQQTFADGQVHEYECQATGVGGRKRTFWRTAKVADPYEDGRPKTVVQVSRDITERKRAEKQIKASLEEKEALLREIHHRVKNNLQVISSLLRLQSRCCDGDAIKETFSECEQRVQSIALVYEKLHGSEDSVGIDFHGYCKSLVPHLFSIFGADPQRVQLRTDIDRITIGADSAVPCGLIVNELLSNCLRHAFPDSKTGHIEVALRKGQDDLIELSVWDDGVGLPPDFDLAAADTLGLRLVKTLAKQLHATTQVDTAQGTRFTVAFRPTVARVS